MSDSKSHDWSKDWQALQKQYWNAWSDLTRNQAGAATPDAATPWHEGLEQWSRMFGNAGKQSEAAERLMASAKGYLSLMQSMLSFATGKDAGTQGMNSWLDAMRGGMNLPGFDGSMFGKMPGFDASAFGKIPGFDPAAFAAMPGFDPASFNMPGFDAAALMNNPMAKALREISGQGIRSFEQLAAGAAPMLQQMQGEAVSWLKAPASGYAREHQEHYQKMALAFVDFQQAVKKYNALIMKSSQRSFEILELKLAERSEPGRQIDSVRALYDLWVDAAEEAYAEIALSEEFRQVYGDVVNSQMRVRSQLQQEVERIGVDLGMPTRTELNSVHKRLHDLRRELRDSQEAVRDADSDGRDAEIAAMRAEIDDLRRLVENLDPGATRGRAAAVATAKPRAARPKRARARRKSTPGKRAAAKRTHVAAKTTSVGIPRSQPKAAPAPASRVAPPSAAKPVTVKIVRKPAQRKAVAPRRAVPRKAPAAKTQASAPPKGAGSAPVSFGDAIAAMRRDLGKANIRKARAARQFHPFKSAAVARSRRSTP